MEAYAVKDWSQVRRLTNRLRPAIGAEVKAEQERAKRRRAKKAATMRKLRAEGRAS
jgi:hypothetical protein